MRNKHKNILIRIITIFSIIVTISGCLNNTDTYKDKEIVQKSKEEIAMEYLYEKYDSTNFEIISCGKNELDKNFTVLFKDKNSDNIYELSINKDNECKDNYYGQYIRKDYDKYIESLLEQNGFINCKVYTDFTTIKGIEIGKDLTPQEIIDNKLSKHTNIFIEKESNNIKEIENFIKETNIYGSYVIYEIESMEEIGDINTLREYVRDINTEDIEKSFFNTF